MTLLSPGIHLNVPFSDYLSDPGINQSELKKFGMARSPYHYKYKKDHPEEDEDPAHFKIGRYVDCGVFRPKELNPNDFASLKASEIRTAEACILSVLSHRDAARLIMACQSQVVVIAHTEPRRKGLIDLLPDPERCDPLLLDYAFDLKSAADASAEGFANACYKFGYHIQAAYYIDLLATVGLKITTFGFIVVETKPPYAVAIHYMPSDSHEITLGRTLYQRWLKDYSSCLEKDQWPDYGDSWTRIRFKPWHFRDIQEPERIS